MEIIIEKLHHKTDDQGYLPYPYAMQVGDGWAKGLIHIDWLRDYLEPYATLDEAIENTKSEGLRLLLIDYKSLD